MLVAGVSNRNQNTVEVERFLNEIVCTLFERFNSRFDVAMPGDNYDRCFRSSLFYFGEYFYAKSSRRSLCRQASGPTVRLLLLLLRTIRILEFP